MCISLWDIYEAMLNGAHSPVEEQRIAAGPQVNNTLTGLMRMRSPRNVLSVLATFRCGDGEESLD